LNPPVLWLDHLRLSDLAQVGGKNSSLGEMIGHLGQLGVSVPGGFATTADAFEEFIRYNTLTQRIYDRLDGLDIDDVGTLMAVGREIRQWVMDAPLQPTLDAAIREAYAELCKRAGADQVSVAVRSSATAEDLPDASFAGQQETFLNVTGVEDVVAKVKEVFASLYNDRAIAYRVHHGFKHEDVFLSAGVQLMVRSDIGSSGVLFTLDTESGFRDAVFITASYGLGENVVQGAVNPDEFYVYKPTLRQGKQAILRRTLGSKQIRMVYSDVAGERVRNEPTPEELRNRFCISDADVEELARQALVIEEPILAVARVWVEGHIGHDPKPRKLFFEGGYDLWHQSLRVIGLRAVGVFFGLVDDGKERKHGDTQAGNLLCSRQELIKTEPFDSGHAADRLPKPLTV